jgi:hypothetical protein
MLLKSLYTWSILFSCVWNASVSFLDCLKLIYNWIITLRGMFAYWNPSEICKTVRIIIVLSKKPFFYLSFRISELDKTSKTVLDGCQYLITPFIKSTPSWPSYSISSKTVSKIYVSLYLEKGYTNFTETWHAYLLKPGRYFRKIKAPNLWPGFKSRWGLLL